MKNLLSIFIASAMILCTYALPAQAESMDKFKKGMKGIATSPSVDRFKEGAVDFITSPLEFGKQTARYTDKYENNAITGAVAGLLEGTGAFAHKLVGGFFKMMTAPFPGDC